jgi:TPR repeat protein
MKSLLMLPLFVLMAVTAFGADFSDTLKKADAGNADAAYEVGLAYLNGDGAEQDEAKALVYFEKAAYKGHSEAQYELGQAIFNGYGTEADHIKGCAWLYTTKEPAAMYVCTQIDTTERTKSIEESEKLKKLIK